MMGARNAVARWRRALPGVPALLLLLAAATVGMTASAARAADEAAPAATTTGAAASGARPNIILVVTDDQEVALVDKMPRVKKLLGEGGTSFTHAFYNDPLCCPSRATMLTGRYVQNHGVYANLHSLFLAADNEDRTIALWLHDAGYRTGLVGKYLNNYPKPMPFSYVPPGWDDWHAAIAGGTIVYDYRLEENGKIVRYGRKPDDYVTDVFRRKAVAFIKDSIGQKKPFFLAFTPHSPHVPAIPAPRHAGLFAGLRAPKSPAFDEADVSDKPAYVKARAPIGAEAINGIDQMYLNRVRSLQAVDEAVQAMADTLEAAGQLENTYIVFVSDNGWSNGQHRLRAKGLPYEEVLRMPLLVRGPGVPAGATLDHLVGNVDLASTFAEWAGLQAPEGVDGRSLAPLLRGEEGAPTPDQWRQAFPIRFDPTHDSEGERWGGWRGLRTQKYTYVEYATGERELYDDIADPYQLRNIAKTAGGALIGDLHERTVDLNGCAAEACRTLEDKAVP